MKMKKLISVGLAVVMALAMTSIAFAVAPRYNVIASFDTSGRVTSTSAYASTTAVFGESVDATVKLTLERSKDGSSFSRYRTLASESKYGRMIGVEGEATGLSSSYEYRIKAEVFAYDDNGNEIDYDYAYID